MGTQPGTALMMPPSAQGSGSTAISVRGPHAGASAASAAANGIDM
jgi:hypothetical protein